MQTTLSKTVRFAGVGLHGGRRSRVAVVPAPVGHGIVFRRVDAAGGGVRIPALWSQVTDATLCTRIGTTDATGTEVSIATIEHLMAALAGCGITNALLEVDGAEVPILDGSAAPFVDAFLAAGLRRQPAPLQAIRLRRPVEVRAGAASARLDPAESFEMAFCIDFEDAAIGVQELAMPLANGRFVQELSDSRTFCRLRDVEAMRARGLALGGSFENAVVVEGAQVLTPGGLRHADEPVRHKMLDALGDLALAGAPLLARYTGVRAGHALTAALLAELFARPDAWERVTLDARQLARLPGAGLQQLQGRPRPALRATA